MLVATSRDNIGTMKKQNKNVRVINPSKEMIISEKDIVTIQNLAEESGYYSGFCDCDTCKDIKDLLNRLKEKEKEEGGRKKTNK